MGKLLISASEAAKIIGCGAQKVREHLKHGVWTFGQYVPKEQSGSSRGRVPNQPCETYGIPWTGGEEECMRS